MYDAHNFVTCKDRVPGGACHREDKIVKHNEN